MIYGNLKNGSGTRYVPTVLRRVFRYLEETDFSNIGFGIYTPDKQFSLQVINLKTQYPQEKRVAVHRENLDIHYSINGNETVYVRVSPVDIPISDHLFSDRDIGFYDIMEEEVDIPMNLGDFVVFFPGEIHRPGCCRHKPMHIKKIVIKVPQAHLI